MTQKIALDVWLKFADENDEESEYEANTFLTDDGTYRVEWYHTAVGLVLSKEFKNYETAADWLEQRGFIDFTA